MNVRLRGKRARRQNFQKLAKRNRNQMEVIAKKIEEIRRPA